tara:strand:+ start:222 stop:2087 length:1866 start_codon:yes stop_codon:yes gene_type:complete
MQQTVVVDDLLLMTDISDDKKTKSVKISALPFTNNAGTVTSVALTMPAAFAVANSPITTAGTLAVTPTGGASGQYLDYTGNWSTPAGGAANPAGLDTQVQYNDGGSSFGAGAFFTTNKSNKVDIAYELGLKGDGGSNQGLLKLYCEAGTAHHVGIKGPNHTGGTPASYTIQLPNSLPNVANQILESNASGTLSWIPTPSGGGGGSVDSVNTTDGTYINLTPNSATTGAVTVTADLSAVDGTSDTATRFLSKDNTWDVPSYTTAYSLPLAANGTRGGIQIGYAQNAKNYPVVLSAEKAYVNVPWTDTNTTYALSAPSANIIRLNDGSSNDDISLTAGSGVTLSQLAANNITFTNNDRGSSQYIFKNIAVQGQSTITADNNNDTLSFVAGSGITLTTDSTNDRVTITNSGAGGATNGSLLKTNIYYNDSTNPASYGSYSIPSSTTLGQVAFTPTVSGVAQNVGISFTRSADFDVYRVQLTMSVVNQQDPDTIHMGLHYTTGNVTGANCWYGWQNPGILDSDGSIRNIALTCYWDIAGSDLRYFYEEEWIEAPNGTTVYLYLKAAASGTGTLIQFATDGTRGINGGWNNGNGIPSTTNVSGMPLIMTVYGLNASVRSTNPGATP